MAVMVVAYCAACNNREVARVFGTADHPFWVWEGAAKQDLPFDDQGFPVSTVTAKHDGVVVPRKHLKIRGSDRELFARRVVPSMYVA